MLCNRGIRNILLYVGGSSNALKAGLKAERDWWINGYGLLIRPLSGVQLRSRGIFHGAVGAFKIS